MPTVSGTEAADADLIQTLADGMGQKLSRRSARFYAEQLQEGRTTMGEVQRAIQYAPRRWPRFRYEPLAHCHAAKALRYVAHGLDRRQGARCPCGRTPTPQKDRFWKVICECGRMSTGRCTTPEAAILRHENRYGGGGANA
jgi:hypothetical protein